MKINYFIFFLTLILLQYSCQKIDFEPKNFKSKLGVKAILDTKFGLSVAVSKSLNPYKEADTSQFGVAKSRIYLFENNKLIAQAQETTSRGFYKNTTLKLIENATYFVKVESEGFDPVYSDTLIMPPTPSVSVSRKSIEKNDFNSGYSVMLDITLNDNHHKEVFYNVDAYAHYLGYGILNGIFISTLPSCTITENIVAFSNNCFLENTIKFRALLQPELQAKVAYFLLSTTTKDTYSYYEAQDQPFAIEWLFAEPKSSYSNMHNGYGIFLIKNTREFRIPVQ